MTQYNVTVAIPGTNFINAGEFNVKAYGAIGNGVADDTVAIQAAVTAAGAAGGGGVLFTRGDYVANEIALASGVIAWGSGGVRILKPAGSVSDDNNVFNAYGAVTAVASDLSADVTASDTTVDVDDGSVFAAGDYCLLGDETYADGASIGRNQEIVRVASVTSNTVTLEAMAIGDYTTADSGDLVKITPVVGSGVHNLEIVIPVGTNTGGGIRSDLAVGFSVDGCKITGPNDNSAVEVLRTSDSFISRNSVYDGQNLSAAGYGYAFIIGESSHGVSVFGNYQEHVRESACTNRTRNVTFMGNVGRDSGDSHFNTHGSWCDGVTISGNTSVGGTHAYAVGYATHSKGDSNVVVSNNVIKNTGSTAITVSSPTSKESSGVSITGNNISRFGLVSSASNGILISRTSGCSVSANLIDGESEAKATYCILASNAVDSSISGNAVRGISNGYGITVTDCTNVHVTANSAQDISSFNFRATGTNTGCIFSANSGDDATVSTGAVLVSGNSWQNSSGSPEGNLTAPIGSLYQRTDGGAGTSLYIKESGTSSTGWIAVITS